MKKRDLKKLALLGIAGGLMLTPQSEVQADQDEEFLSGLMAAGCGSKGCSHQKAGCGSNQSSCGGTTRGSGCGSRQSGCGSQSGRGVIAISDSTYQENASGQLMTEDQLQSQLNEQGKQMFRGLSPEGKTLAIKLASRSCKGTNDCKGQGACKTADHSCAGRNTCAATSTCSFRDKNLAVKIAAQQQAQKRMQTNSGSY